MALYPKSMTGTSESLFPVYPHGTSLSSPPPRPQFPVTGLDGWILQASPCTRVQACMHVCTCLFTLRFTCQHTHSYANLCAFQATVVFPTLRNSCQGKWEVVGCTQACCSPARDGYPLRLLPSPSLWKQDEAARKPKALREAPETWLQVSQLLGKEPSLQESGMATSCCCSQCTPDLQGPRAIWVRPGDREGRRRLPNLQPG